MAFEIPSANNLQRVQRRPSTPGQASDSGISEGARPQADKRPSQLPQQAAHETSSEEHRAIYLTVESTDGDDVEDGEWTQIPGPADNEMSDSDVSSVVPAVQYQVPIEIQKAEQDASHQRPGPHTVPDIHTRYKGFPLRLCRETATDDADQHVLDGLNRSAMSVLGGNKHI